MLVVLHIGKLYMLWDVCRLCIVLDIVIIYMLQDTVTTFHGSEYGYTLHATSPIPLMSKGGVCTFVRGHCTLMRVTFRVRVARRIQFRDRVVHTVPHS